MVEKGNPAGYLLTHDLVLLLRRLLPVEAQGEDDENIAVGNAGGVDRIDQYGKEQFALHQPRNVIHHDGDAFAAMQNLGERGRAERVGQSLAHCGLEGLAAGEPTAASRVSHTIPAGSDMTRTSEP